jgi:hypothetical protein
MAAPEAPIPEPIGSIPPQNLEAEESVLGAMMISPGAIVAVRDVVDPGDFYRESHARIYRAALHLHDAGDPVDAITLVDELERRGELDKVGGRVRVHELSNLVPVSANARHYAEIVRDAATMRGLIVAGGEISQLGWDREGTVGDLVERARQIADQLLERGRIAKLEAQTWAEFERDATEQIPLLVDQLWPEAGLGFIAAPPKKGKTWIGLDLAIAVATGTSFLGRFHVDKPAPVVLIALEGHKAAIRGRIGCLARGRGFDPGQGSQDLANLHVLHKPAGINLNDPGWARDVHQLADSIGARLLVVDVLRAAARLKENSNDEFGELVRTLQPITLGGCALALVHHFGKLTELSRDRAPGERMAGAGAMQGAYDVGIFITGSDHGARKLRVEFETRDLPSPDKIGVELSGTPSGPNGGFTFTDQAYWTEAETPSMDDVKGPAEQIAEWVREQGGDVEKDDVLDHFHISPNTLRARLHELEELGIEWIPGRGKGSKTRLVADVGEQLDVDDLSAQSLCAVKVRNCAQSDVDNKEPHDQAESGLSAQSAQPEPPDDCAQRESADLQAHPSAQSAHSPTESKPPADAAAAHRELDPDDDDPFAE